MFSEIIIEILLYKDFQRINPVTKLSLYVIPLIVKITYF